MESHLSIILSVLTLIGILLGFWDKIFRRGGKEQKLDDRIVNLEKSDTDLKGSICSINEDIKKIKENHLAHIQTDINDIKVNMAQINTTLQFLKEK